MTRDEKKSMAYNDCSNYEGPSMPYDEEYMQRYNFWRPIAKFPLDSDEYWGYDDLVY